MLFQIFTLLLVEVEDGGALTRKVSRKGQLEALNKVVTAVVHPLTALKVRVIGSKDC